MNLLLLFFAIPLAVIILSIVLQKILNCPWLVAATFFAIFLILTFTIGNIEFLVLAIAYTIISFITALIIKFICKIISEDGITFRNINTQNINARRVNTNVLRTNKIRENDNNDDAEDSNQDGNGCDCNIIRNGINNCNSNCNICRNRNNNCNIGRSGICNYNGNWNNYYRN